MNQGKIRGYQLSPEKRRDKPDKEDKETEAAEDGGEKPESGNQSALWGTGRKAPEKYYFYTSEP